MPINMADIVNDPDFACTYSVFRTQGEWQQGRFILAEPEEIRFYGAVQPTRAKELEQIPDGERPSSAISFHSTKRFYLTSEAKDASEGGYISDVILWHGDRYKVLIVKDWSANGYWKAIATQE